MSLLLLQRSKFLKSLRQMMLDPVLAKIDEMEERLFSRITKLTNDIQITNNDSVKVLKESVPQTPQTTVAVYKKDNLLSNKKYNIQKISGFEQEFFWITHVDATDPISISATKGVVLVDMQLLTFFKKPGTFLDIGANIGAFTLTLSANGWNGFGIEASSRNIEVLTKSIMVNNFDVKIYEGAVFEYTGVIYFLQNGPWGVVQTKVYEDAGGGHFEEISCMCLNDYEKTVLREIRHLDLIKMDIEGSEVAAMRGMDDFVRRFNHPPIYAEMNSLGLFPQGETSLSFFQQAKKLGYVPYEIIGDWLYEYNIENFPDKIFRDFLFLREIPEFLKDKIRPQINQEENKITKYILDNLQAYVSDKERIIDGITIEQYAICICYSLKDYPNYFNKPEINDLLSIIAKEKPQPYFVGKAIEWYVGAIGSGLH